MNRSHSEAAEKVRCRKCEGTGRHVEYVPLPGLPVTRVVNDCPYCAGKGAIVRTWDKEQGRTGEREE